MISKLTFSAAFALAVAVGLATSAAADPSAFRVLSCSCEQAATAMSGAPAVNDQINLGIQTGLADMRSATD